MKRLSFLVFTTIAAFSFLLCLSACAALVIGTWAEHHLLNTYGPAALNRFRKMRAQESETPQDQLTEIFWTAILPIAWLITVRRAKSRRRQPGHCPTCGYDLRATPARCPECGNIAPK